MSSKSSSRDLILTKIAPSLRATNQMARENLARRLDEVISRRLTLIQAPAGYGKTSLLTQWYRMLLERNVQVAWLTLEQEEADPSRFAEYVMAALDSTGGAESGSMPLRTALSAIVNRLSRTGRDTVLLCDDFHRAESEEVREFLRSLIRLAPRSLHIVIASRDYPSLGQAALAADDDLLELGVEDLKLTLTEAEALFGRNLDVKLTRSEVSTLLQRTEGWPIALQMAALSLCKGQAHSEIIASFSGAGWDLARYLSEQVLASLPADIESILARTAVVDRLSAELVNLLCDREDGARVLESLEQLNLFLVPLDPQRQSWRYHQMFAEFLRDRLARRDPALFRRVHHTVAEWFARHGRIPEAVKHAMRVDDVQFLAGILDGAGGWRMVPEGLLDPLVAGLGKLPDDVVARFPRLMLARVYVLFKCGDMDLARERYDAFRASLEPSSLPAELWTEVNLVGDVLSEYENAPVTLDDLLAKEALMRRLPSSDHLMLASVCESLGAKYCDCGWLERALEPTLQARAHHRALGSGYGELFCRFIEARIKLAQGRLEDADKLLREAWSEIENTFGARSDLAANCAVYQAELKYDRDAADEARTLLEWALPHIEQSDGWFDVYAAGFSTAMRVAAAKSFGEAQQTTERTRSLAKRRHLRQLELLADTLEVELLIGTCQDTLAQQRAEEFGIRELAAQMRQDAPTYRHVAVMAALCQIKLDLLSGNGPAVLTQLKRIEQWARQHGQGRLLVTLCILHAAADRLTDQPDNAVLSFDEAVGMAMFQGFISPFLDCWRFVIIPAAGDEQTTSVREPDRFRQQFLTRLRKALKRHCAQDRNQALLTVLEVETLRHLNRGFTNKEIARQLSISPNTVKDRLKSLYEKLRVSSRQEAVRVCREQRLVDH